MRPVLTWVFRALMAVALIIIAIAVWKREEITRLMAVNSLFSEDKIVSNFSNMNKAFLWAEMDRGTGSVTPLPKGETATLPPEVADWITERRVTSLLVLKDGQIVFEDYYQGTKPTDRRISWSMAKSYLSALFGIIREDGLIPDLDVPVTDYVPALAGTGYADATIRNVLQMSSGVMFDEDYLDYDSDINRMGRVLALGQTMDGFAATITQKDRPAGELFEYTSIDTHVLGMVLRAATGRSVIELMQDRLIAPMGLEATPYYLTDGEGVAFVLGGLNMTTRDYARMGLMFAQNGRLGGTQIVPEAWVRDSTAPSAPTPQTGTLYGYQWWIPRETAPHVVMARGIYGQYIYIDRTADTVIVTTGADRNFRDPGVGVGNEAMFRLITGNL